MKTRIRIVAMAVALMTLLAVLGLVSENKLVWRVWVCIVVCGLATATAIAPDAPIYWFRSWRARRRQRDKVTADRGIARICKGQASRMFAYTGIGLQDRFAYFAFTQVDMTPRVRGRFWDEWKKACFGVVRIDADLAWDDLTGVLGFQVVHVYDHSAYRDHVRSMGMALHAAGLVGPWLREYREEWLHSEKSLVPVDACFLDGGEEQSKEKEA